MKSLKTITNIFFMTILALLLQGAGCEQSAAPQDTAAADSAELNTDPVEETEISKKSGKGGKIKTPDLEEESEELAAEEEETTETTTTTEATTTQTTTAESTSTTTATTATTAEQTTTTTTTTTNETTQTTQTQTQQQTDPEPAPALAALAANKFSYAFGQSFLGTKKNISITLTASGNKAKGISFATTAPFAKASASSGTNCGTELAKDATCSFDIEYNPSSIGDHSANLTITYLEKENSSKTITIAVTGASYPNITGISPTSGVATNAITISGSNFTSNTVIKLGTANCPVTSQTATQIVCTAPTNTTGSKVVSATENSKEDLYSNFTYLANATISLSATSKTFTDVRIDNTEAFTITATNNGGVAATSLAFSGLAAPHSKSGGTCGTSLAAGASCTIEVTYAPTTVGTDQDDTLEIDYNDGSANQALNVTLSGNSKDRIIQVSAGEHATCALFKAGNIKCVGHMQLLGDGNGSSNTSSWVDVTGISNATSIDVHEDIACAVLSDGKAKCWGKFKPADTNDYHTPEDIGLTDVAEVRSGDSNTLCARKTDDTVWCRGEGSYGQIGNGESNDKTAFTQVTGTFKGLSAGGEFIVTYDGNGKVKAWGRNNTMQIGTDQTSTVYNSPREVDGLTNISQIAAGQHTACALDTSGEVHCWGRDNYGQLGDGSITATNYDQVKNVDLDNVTAISGGFNHTCALLSDKTAKCWGYADYGQLGNNDNSTLGYATPQSVQNLTNITQIDAGSYHTCALVQNGDVYCWGHNSTGGLGTGDTVAVVVPTKVSGLYE